MNGQRYHTVKKMLNHYNLNNEVESKCFTDPDIMAMFNFNTGNIQICDSSVVDREDFIMTSLHEIGHAAQADRLGLNNFADDYNDVSDNLSIEGHDEYSDNHYEIEAENFAQSEYYIWQSSPV